MATVSEGDRARLYHGIAENVGDGEAETLMQLLPTSQWEDLATRSELADLRVEMRREFTHVATKTELASVRVEVADLRSEMRVGFETVNSRFAEMDRLFSAQSTELDGRFTAFSSELDGRYTAFSSELDGRFATFSAEMDAKLERGLRNQIIWLVGTIVVILPIVSFLQSHL